MLREILAESRVPVLQKLAKQAERGAIPTRLGNRKIVVLSLEWFESQTGFLCNRLDRDSPVCTTLRYCRRDRIMRARLVDITGGTSVSEQAIYQDSCTCASVAIDHSQR